MSYSTSGLPNQGNKTAKTYTPLCAYHEIDLVGANDGTVGTPQAGLEDWVEVVQINPSTNL